MGVSQLAQVETREAVGPEGPGIHFVLQLGKALHRYGTPAHRLEEVMTVVSQQLGLTSRFVSTPTAIYASFGPPEDLRATLIRVEPGEMNLERMSQIDAITTEVISGRKTPDQGAALLDQILAGPPVYGRLVTVICYALAAAAGAQLFGGGLEDIGASGVLGLGMGLLAIVAERRPGIARVFEPLAAFGVSALSVAGTHVFRGYSPQVTTLAALIFLLPGLTLTVAMTELATRNLVSGTSRLTGAMLVFLQLGFGVALGRRIDVLLPPAPAPLAGTPLPGWASIPVLVVTTLALAVLFRARIRDAGIILIAGALAYGGGRLGAMTLGPELGAFLGAVILGIGSNAFGRLFDRPAIISLVPGIMLLVPGALGFRSLESFLAEDVLAGVGTAFSVIMMAVAIVAGTLLANSIVPPRKIL